MKKLIALLLLTCVLVLGLASCGDPADTTPADTTAAPDALAAPYAAAMAHLAAGEYEEAYAALVELGDYQDAAQHLARLCYVPTKMTYKMNGIEIVTLTATLGANKLPATLTGTFGDDSETATLTYDAAGRIIEITSPSGTEVERITYNAQGKEILRTYIEDGEVSYSEGYTYNDAGLMTEDFYVDEDGNHVTESTYEYDANGNLIREVEHLGDEEYATTYTYNAAGLLIKKEYTEYGEIFSAEEYTYDANGRLTKTSFFYDGELVGETVPTYDENGNKTEETETYFAADEDDVDSVTRYVYTYDADGCMLSMTVYTDGELAYKNERTYNAAHKLTSDLWTAGELSQSTTYEYSLEYLAEPLSEEAYEAILAMFTVNAE